jgi:hypothetical protein
VDPPQVTSNLIGVNLKAVTADHLKLFFIDRKKQMKPRNGTVINAKSLDAYKCALKKAFIAYEVPWPISQPAEKTFFTGLAKKIIDEKLGAKESLEEGKDHWSPELKKGLSENFLKTDITGFFHAFLETTWNLQCRYVIYFCFVTRDFFV